MSGGWRKARVCIVDMVSRGVCVWRFGEVWRSRAGVVPRYDSDPQCTTCEHRETIKKSRSVLVHCGEGVGRIFVGTIFWRANQKDTTMGRRAAEDQFSKVLVGSQEECLFAACEIEYFRISDSG
jgi:hypothetical protein